MCGLRPTHSSHPRPGAIGLSLFVESDCHSSLLSREELCFRSKPLLNSPKFPAHMSSAAAVTDASFEQDVLQSDVPVLWTSGTLVRTLPHGGSDRGRDRQEFDGQIKVFKLNTDENPNVASQYGIRSIPTLMVFKGGQKVDTVVGAVPKATLSGTISSTSESVSRTDQPVESEPRVNRLRHGQSPLCGEMP